MTIKADDTLKLQGEILDLTDALNRIKDVTLPDALDTSLTVFQRKYLLRVFNQMGEALEECIGKIHSI